MPVRSAVSIVARGKHVYETDEVAQEAGDSLIIEVGEAAKTIAARGLPSLAGVRRSDAAKDREKLRSPLDREAT